LRDRADQFRFLIRDRDSKFTTAFDAVLTGADIRIIRTPVRAPIVLCVTGSPRRERPTLGYAIRHLGKSHVLYRLLACPPVGPAVTAPG
jgi:hypothetical protein